MAVSIEASDSSLAVGPSINLFQVPGRPTECNISRDGRFLMVVAPEQSPAPVTIVLNWGVGLKHQ
jgi:hypothetical protein